MIRGKKVDPIFNYYQQELDLLHKHGSEFAKKYPQIAANLGLSGAGSTDPQTERMIESFAFLTSKLRLEIDSEFPRIAESILLSLYPQLIRPIPSMTILRMDISGDKGNAVNGFRIERGESFFYDDNRLGKTIQFSNCYTTDIFPIDVSGVEIGAAEDFKLKSSSTIDPRKMFLKISLINYVDDFSNEATKKLILYINGNQAQKNLIHEILTLCNKSYVKMLGFSSDQSILPVGNESHPAFRILLEYFNYIDKFFFFELDISQLSHSEADLLNIHGNTADIFIPISDKIIMHNTDIDKSNILTNCIPVVNLFSTTSEPIIFDKRKYEYPVIIDSSLDHNIEVYSINNVYSTNDDKPTPYVIKPFFGFDHIYNNDEKEIFWSASYSYNKAESSSQGAKISFHGPDFSYIDNCYQIIYMDVMASNTSAASEIPINSNFSTNSALPADRVINITKPSDYKPGISDGSLLWKLVSHLSINHTSFSNDNDSLKSFKEIMGIYSRHNINSNIKQPEIDGIISMDTSITTRSIGVDAWRGFVNGIKVKLVFDDNYIESGNALVFASVMNNFFSLLASANSFSQLEVYRESKNDCWHLWQPIMGVQDLL